jgi:hypothetical protein
VTITSTPSEVSYAGDDVSTVFPIPFVFDTSADLKVIRTDEDGNPEVLSAGFSVSGGAGSTGTLTLDDPLATDTALTILDDPEATQPVDYTANDAFPAEAHEGALDRNTRLIKRLIARFARTVRFPDGDPVTDGAIGSVEARKGKYLFFNAITGAVEYATNLVTTTLSQSIIGDLFYPQNGAEATAGVTPVNKFIDYYHRGRYATWADWRAACDQGNAEGVIEAVGYTLTGNITLPRKVRGIGTLAGAFTVTWGQQSAGGYINGLHLSDAGATLILRGAQRCAINFIQCRKVEIDGFNSTYGFFWNVMIGWMVEEVEADITNWSINQNTWIACVMRYFHTEGDTSTYAFTEFNANKLFACDFSNYADASLPIAGCRQNDSVRRKNTLYGPYIEVTNSLIVGEWTVYDLHSDADQPAEVGLDCHLLGSNSNNEKQAGDFLSVSTVSIITGGDWRVRGSDNKPPSYGNIGGASVSVQADATEPFGAGSRYQATFEHAGDRFTIQVRGSGRSTCAGYVFYKSEDDFVQIDVTDGTSTASLTARPLVVDEANDWKMVRFRGPAHPVNGAGVSLYAYAGAGGAAKVMSLGSSSAGAEQACVTPQRPDVTRRFAIATVNPASLDDGNRTSPATVTVTGAALGDVVDRSFNLDLQGLDLHTYVSAADTVTYYFANETGGTVNLGEGSLYVEARSRLS